jgi:hypothetical protein
MAKQMTCKRCSIIVLTLALGGGMTWLCPGAWSEQVSIPIKEKMPMIDEQEARRIAQEQAARVYRDLSVYRVTAQLKADTWYVDYDIADPGMVGGGPHLVISAATGEVLSMRCEQ